MNHLMTMFPTSNIVQTYEPLPRNIVTRSITGTVILRGMRIPLTWMPAQTREAGPATRGGDAIARVNLKEQPFSVLQMPVAHRAINSFRYLAVASADSSGLESSGAH